MEKRSQLPFKGFLILLLGLALGFFLGRRGLLEFKASGRPLLPSGRTSVSAMGKPAGKASYSKDFKAPVSTNAAPFNVVVPKGEGLPSASGDYLEGELVLKLRDGASMAGLLALLKENGMAAIGTIDELGLIRVVLPEGTKVRDAEDFFKDVDAVAKTIRNAPVTLEPDPVDREALASCAPVGSSALSMMSGTEIQTGAMGDGVLVAVLDTGVALTEVLQGRLFAGHDFVGDMAYQTDNNGHGTACATLIAGSGANGGIRGVAPEARILPVKVMDDRGKSDGFGMAEGIVYAVQEGAKIINLSLGTTSETTLLDAALEYAESKDVLIVASSGNQGKEGESYPGNHPGVLCVGAVDGEGWKAPFSNYGPNIDLVAPGVLVACGTIDGGTALMSGTSASAPLVCGAAALLWSREKNLTAEEVAEKLMATADDLGSAGADDWYGAGLVDLHRLLLKGEEEDLALACVFFDPPDLVQGQTVEMVATFQNRGTSRLPDGKVKVLMDGEESVERLPSLEPGESAEYRRRLALPLKRVKTELSLEIRGVTGGTDQRPLNDGRRITIR